MLFIKAFIETSADANTSCFYSHVHSRMAAAVCILQQINMKYSCPPHLLHQCSQYNPGQNMTQINADSQIICCVSDSSATFIYLLLVLLALESCRGFFFVRKTNKPQTTEGLECLKINNSAPLHWSRGDICIKPLHCFTTSGVTSFHKIHSRASINIISSAFSAVNNW